MSLPPLPKLDPANYRWYPSPDDPHAVQRLALGTEAWVGLREPNARGQYDNYINTILRVEDPSLSLSLLAQHSTVGLLHIRYRHPEIACTAVWDPESDSPGPPHIKYTPPASATAALQWARDAVLVWCTTQTGLEVAAELSEHRQTNPKPLPPVTIFVVADVTDKDMPLELGSCVDVLLQFNHIYWDAISARVFVGDLLHLLGEQLGTADVEKVSEQYAWGDETANLNVPVLDACKVDVGTLGEDYEKTRDEFILNLITSGVTIWSLPNLPRYFCGEIIFMAITDQIEVQLGPSSHCRSGQAADDMAHLHSRRKPSYEFCSQDPARAALHHHSPWPRSHGTCPPSRQSPASGCSRVYCALLAFAS